MSRLGYARHWQSAVRILPVHHRHGSQTGHMHMHGTYAQIHFTNKRMYRYDIWTETYTNAYPQIYPINIVQEEKERAFEKDFERFCPHFVRDSDIEDDSQRITVKNLMDVFKVTAGLLHHHQPHAFHG